MSEAEADAPVRMRTWIEEKKTRGGVARPTTHEREDTIANYVKYVGVYCSQPAAGSVERAALVIAAECRP